MGLTRRQTLSLIPVGGVALMLALTGCEFSTYLSSGDTAPIRLLRAPTNGCSAFWYIFSVTFLLLPEVSFLLIHRQVWVYVGYDTTCGYVNNDFIV